MKPKNSCSLQIFWHTLFLGWSFRWTIASLHNDGVDQTPVSVEKENDKNTWWNKQKKHYLHFLNNFSVIKITSIAMECWCCWSTIRWSSILHTKCLASIYKFIYLYPKTNFFIPKSLSSKINFLYLSSNLAPIHLFMFINLTQKYHLFISVVFLGRTQRMVLSSDVFHYVVAIYWTRAKRERFLLTIHIRDDSKKHWTQTLSFFCPSPSPFPTFLPLSKTKWNVDVYCFRLFISHTHSSDCLFLYRLRFSRPKKIYGYCHCSLQVQKRTTTKTMGEW